MSKFKKAADFVIDAVTGNLDEGDRPPPQRAPAALPSRQDEGIKETGRETRKRARRRRGLTSTIRTSGLGDPSEATVRRQTLLGGS